MTETGEITSRDSLGRLTQLSKEIEALILQYEEQSNASPETLTKALDQVQGQWLKKVESIGHLVKDYEHMAKTWEEERVRLDNMAKALKMRTEWLKNYLMFNEEVSHDMAQKR